jgi:hypothetical protein
MAFSGASQRWEFKNTTDNFLQKIASKSFFPKVRQKNPKPIFLGCFITLLGVSR